jgi:hypothetical protein
MATPEELTHHLLSHQMQQLQEQFAAAMAQSQQERDVMRLEMQQEREAMRHEIQTLAVENRSLRAQAAVTRIPLVTSENFSKQIKVEDFYGETGDKYRIFRMHLSTRDGSVAEKRDFPERKPEDTKPTVKITKNGETPKLALWQRCPRQYQKRQVARTTPTGTPFLPLLPLPR